MKTINYQIKTNTGDVEVSGYSIVNDWAVRKTASGWHIDHTLSGLRASAPFSTRKAAIDYFNANYVALDTAAERYMQKRAEKHEEPENLPEITPIQKPEIAAEVCEAIAEIYDRKHPRPEKEPEKRIINPAYKDGGKLYLCPEAENMKDGKWATWAQWKKLGYKVIKGERQTLVSYTDASGNLRKYGVFHESQVSA